eukprot:EG_transcript_17553
MLRGVVRRQPHPLPRGQLVEQGVVLGSLVGNVDQDIGRGRSKSYSGPDPAQKPKYDDSDLVSIYLLGKFRASLAEQGYASPTPGYAGFIETIRAVNSSATDAAVPQRVAYRVEESILPGWLPTAYRASFARYMPKGWQAPMFAWITTAFFRWLVGDCEVVDGETDGGPTRRWHTVQIKRCRFLEEAGCASVCVNSCKIPTQEWFRTDFAMDLRVTPNYDDFSCKFEMDRPPLPLAEDPALVVPCLLQCPAKAPLRFGPGRLPTPTLTPTPVASEAEAEAAAEGGNCARIAAGR